MTGQKPSRGEVWMAELDPVRGHEQGGRRPAVVISTDLFNRGPAGLIIALLITSTYRGIRSHLAIEPPEGGVRRRSYVKCEDVRSISTERLVERWGALSSSTMQLVGDRLRILLEL